MKQVFSRQVLLWGEEGQERLKKASVLVAGAGGLGSNVSECLVRLGIGKIYIVDPGKVDPPDLNRQILYTKADLGLPKVLVAKKRLEEKLESCKVIALHQKIDMNFELPEGVDVVVDALDNWKTRFELEEACAKKKVPFVHAGLMGTLDR